MKKFVFTRISIFALAGLLAAGCVGCGGAAASSAAVSSVAEGEPAASQAAEASSAAQQMVGGGAQLANPWHYEVSAQELADLGCAIAPPEGASDAAYAYTEWEGGILGQVSFTLDGKAYTYRLAPTADTDADFADISGVYGPFATVTDQETTVSYCPARLSYTEGETGKLVWFDAAPGLVYSLGMDEGADEASLADTAALLFAPAQGDVG